MECVGDIKYASALASLKICSMNTLFQRSVINRHLLIWSISISSGKVETYAHPQGSNEGLFVTGQYNYGCYCEKSYNTINKGIGGVHSD